MVVVIVVVVIFAAAVVVAAAAVVVVVLYLFTLNCCVQSPKNKTKQNKTKTKTKTNKLRNKRYNELINQPTNQSPTHPSAHPTSQQPTDQPTSQQTNKQRVNVYGVSVSYNLRRSFSPTWNSGTAKSVGSCSAPLLQIPLCATLVNVGPVDMTLYYEGESKSNAFLFSTGRITDVGSCVIHPNEAGPLWSHPYFST